jgi:MoaA/NifB/PqqE/SkfB family radical SAM enzyme
MFGLLQTSPYLTYVSPGGASPIVFAVDELEPVRPDLSAPAGAAFGVIGLDRSIVWHSDSAALDAMQHAAPTPVHEHLLTDAYGGQVVSDLVGRGWLQRPSDLCREYFLTTAQIEVTAHCNWGCSFCPVSVQPKPPATMSMELFEEIIDKISVHDTLRYVTFHFFNEPTLDRLFVDRVRVLSRFGLQLRLYTNASNLTLDKIELLEKTGVLFSLVVNLPALQKVDFEELTQSTTHAKSLRNIDSAIKHGLPVTIVVNGSGDDLRHRVNELRQHYEQLNVKVNPALISDRAGVLHSSYNQAVRINGPLRGCAWPVNHAHFSVRGDMFICCNDYYQREIFGNIKSGTVHEIMTSAEAVLLRRRVFGVEDAPADFVCRTCFDQLADFPLRQFRPLSAFPTRERLPCKARTNV